MSSEHTDLSAVIKNVHAKLRRKCHNQSESEVDRIWQNHLQELDQLGMYSSAMHRLATQEWTKRKSHFDSDEPDRIAWIVNKVQIYFEEEDWRRIHRRLMIKTGLKSLTPLDGNGKVKTLDVGSCFNPFGKKSGFDTLAIDIAPASSEVLKCDFTNVPVAEKTVIENNSVSSLGKSSYDCVIFCLLLEYLPVPSMRFDACQKAVQLLKDYGILFIITPDSSHQAKNLKGKQKLCNININCNCILYRYNYN